jgi:hypothetical protein
MIEPILSKEINRIKNMISAVICYQTYYTPEEEERIRKNSTFLQNAQKDKNEKFPYRDVPKTHNLEIGDLVLSFKQTKDNFLYKRQNKKVYIIRDIVNYRDEEYFAIILEKKYCFEESFLDLILKIDEKFAFKESEMFYKESERFEEFFNLLQPAQPSLFSIFDI